MCINVFLVSVCIDVLFLLFLHCMVGRSLGCISMLRICQGVAKELEMSQFPPKKRVNVSLLRIVICVVCTIGYIYVLDGIR